MHLDRKWQVLEDLTDLHQSTRNSFGAEDLEWQPLSQPKMLELRGEENLLQRAKLSIP